MFKSRLVNNREFFFLYTIKRSIASSELMLVGYFKR
jgi:hypothetical protein